MNVAVHVVLGLKPREHGSQRAAVATGREAYKIQLVPSSALSRQRPRTSISCRHVQDCRQSTFEVITALCTSWRPARPIDETRARRASIRSIWP